MNLIVKMMDADGVGYRLVTAGEPIDIEVVAFNPEIGNHPTLKINHGFSSLTKSYPLTGNAYIMNEAGDTISKIDINEISVSKGIRYAEKSNTLRVNLGGIPKETEEELTRLIGNWRELFMKQRPDLARALSESQMSVPEMIRTLAETGALKGPTHPPVADPDLEEQDGGTILAKHSGDGSLGAYLHGQLTDAIKLTLVDIKRFNVYAKPNTIKEMRDTGLYPESKLRVLAENDKKVNGDLAAEALVVAGPELLEETALNTKRVMFHGGIHIDNLGAFVDGQFRHIATMSPKFVREEGIFCECLDDLEKLGVSVLLREALQKNNALRASNEGYAEPMAFQLAPADQLKYYTHIFGHLSEAKQMFVRSFINKLGNAVGSEDIILVREKSETTKDAQGNLLVSLHVLTGEKLQGSFGNMRPDLLAEGGDPTLLDAVVQIQKEGFQQKRPGLEMYRLSADGQHIIFVEGVVDQGDPAYYPVEPKEVIYKTDFIGIMHVSENDDYALDPHGADRPITSFSLKEIRDRKLHIDPNGLAQFNEWVARAGVFITEEGQLKKRTIEKNTRVYSCVKNLKRTTVEQDNGYNWRFLFTPLLDRGEERGAYINGIWTPYAMFTTELVMEHNIYHPNPGIVLVERGSFAPIQARLLCNTNGFYAVNPEYRMSDGSLMEWYISDDDDSIMCR